MDNKISSSEDIDFATFLEMESMQNQIEDLTIDLNRVKYELTKAQNILKQCLSIMPVGYVPTHTVENLPEMIGDLAKALAEETTECEQLERELAEVRKQRDILERALMIIESLYVDGKDTHEDWETIGQIAKQALLRITPTEKNEQTNY